MADEMRERYWGSGVQFTQPTLAAMRFEADRGAEIPEGVSELQADFILRLDRGSRTEILVEFGVEVTGLAGVQAQCVYRASYRLKPGSEEISDPDTAIKGVARMLAPTMLYPFVRENIQTAAVRAGLPELILPVVNFSRTFMEVEVPSAPEDSIAGLEGAPVSAAPKRRPRKKS